MIAAMVSVGAFLLAYVEADRASDAVKDGRAVQSDDLFSSPFSAQPSWLSRAPIDEENRYRCVLYLGFSDGVTVVYDPRAHMVKRISSAGLTVTLRPNVESCV